MTVSLGSGAMAKHSKDACDARTLTLKRCSGEPNPIGFLAWLCNLLLGRAKLESTVRYLGIEVDGTL